MEKTKVWEVKDAKSVGGFRKIQGMSLQEAIINKADSLMYLEAEGQYVNPKKLLGFTCRYNDGIFGGKGGIEVFLHTICSNQFSDASPNYREFRMDFTLWIKGEFGGEFEVDLT